jgi:hypothetical protein
MQLCVVVFCIKKREKEKEKKKWGKKVSKWKKK